MFKITALGQFHNQKVLVSCTVSEDRVTIASSAADPISLAWILNDTLARRLRLKNGRRPDMYTAANVYNVMRNHLFDAPPRIKVADLNQLVLQQAC